MLQLRKSIYLDSLRQPFKSAIVTAARMGADAVEINGTTEIRPSEMSRTAIRHIRKLLSDLNLKVSAIHFPARRGFGDLEQLDRRVAGIKATLSMAYELGAQVVVNRIGKIPTDSEDPRWVVMVEALTEVGKHSQLAGAWVAAKTGAESGQQLKSLIEALPTQSLCVDFDPAELVINGFSPSDAMSVLAENVINCRARDAVTDLSLGRGVEVEMGQGSVDWPALLGALERQSYPGYLAVQSDDPDSYLAQCMGAIKYLNGLF